MKIRFGAALAIQDNKNIYEVIKKYEKRILNGYASSSERSRSSVDGNLVVLIDLYKILQHDKIKDVKKAMDNQDWEWPEKDREPKDVLNQDIDTNGFMEKFGEFLETRGVDIENL